MFLNGEIKYLLRGKNFNSLLECLKNKRQKKNVIL